MAYLRILMLFAVALFIGCAGASDEAVKVNPTEAPAGVEGAKATLNEIAESGELGSGAMSLRENLEASEEGKALLPDMDALEGMTDAEQIKAKAKEMAEKL